MLAFKKKTIEGKGVLGLGMMTARKTSGGQRGKGDLERGG